MAQERVPRCPAGALGFGLTGVLRQAQQLLRNFRLQPLHRSK